MAAIGVFGVSFDELTTVYHFTVEEMIVKHTDRCNNNFLSIINKK